MRNCFVPGCDAFCKKNNLVQRKMFLPPVKLLDKWAELIPNKRLFKKHDRVCERHFNEGDIIEHWEVNINGQIHLTQRDKPKLRENAVPCNNLPDKVVKEEDVLKQQSDTIHIISPTKKRSLDEKEKAPVKRLSKKQKTKVLFGRKVIAEKVKEAAVEDDKANEPQQSFIVIEPEPETEMFSVIAEVTQEDLQEKLDTFDCIYDEAFDVTLPSLLWGIHRDPDRKFIVFSEFNQSLMSISKLLHINDTCHCKTFIKSKLKSSTNVHHEKLTTDFVSTLLDELDKDADNS